MKSSNSLLWLLVILFVGFAFWMISTGKLGFFAGTFINDIWHSLTNMVRPIFRH